MRYQPATDGVDDGEAHMKLEDGYWWLFTFDGDWDDSGAIKDAMTAGISSKAAIPLEDAR